MSTPDPAPVSVPEALEALAPVLAAETLESAAAQAAAMLARRAGGARCGVVLLQSGTVVAEGWSIEEHRDAGAWRNAARQACLAWPGPAQATNACRMSFPIDARTTGLAVLSGHASAPGVLEPLLAIAGLRIRTLLVERGAEVSRLQYERWFRTLDEQVRVLDRERQKFAAMVQQSDAHVFVAGANRLIRWTNESMRQAVAGGEDWVGQSCLAVCTRIGDGPGGGCTECPVERALRLNQTAHREFHREGAAGPHHHYLTALPIRGADGRPQEVMVTIQDLGDLGTLRRSETRYRMLFERSNKAILLVDAASGRILQANPMAARMTGFDTRELAQLHLSALHEPQEWARLESHYVAGMHARVMEPQECRIRPRSGEERIAMVAGARYELGGQDVMMIDLQDVTERRRVEEALRRAEDSLRNVISHAPIVLFALDADGRFTMSEGRGLASLGLRPGQVVGLSVFDVYADYPDLIALVRRALSGEKFTASSTVAERTFEVHYSPMRDGGGRLAGVNGVAIDVTERRHLEEQLVHSQKMEAIGRLAGGVAHDFNNLLAVILGHCEMMLGELEPEHPMRSGIQEIHSAGGRGAQLTRQLLAFSRRDTPAPESLDLRAVVTELDALLRRLIGEDIQLDTELAGEPCVVRADRGQLEQTVLNLVVNARDALPGGGRIRISVGPAEPSPAEVPVAAPEGACGLVRLSVSDDGMGMDEETLAHVFEPFYTTKEQGKGTGLGLSTVYGIAERNAGWVKVESRKGEGSVFEVFLPRFETSECGDLALASSPVHGGHETILLVEDEPAVRELVHEALSGQGYRVLVAPDGPTALERAAEHGERIDLLLTDVVMPGMGGGELARRLGGNRPGVRVLFMSGYTDDAVVRHGVLEARVAFLQKPFRLDELARKVREVLDGPSPLAERGASEHRAA